MSTFGSVNVSGSFNSYHFGEGKFKYAHKGLYQRHPTKAGHPCVVKKMKNQFVIRSTYWDKTIEMYSLSRKLAASFNQKHNCNYSIRFVDVEKCLVRSHETPITEYVLVEDYLEGKFTKWTSNNGNIDPDCDDVLQTFMHYSWVESKGKKMVADLQGVRNNHAFLLTDPAILSNSMNGGLYQGSDIGVKGIGIFFLKHKCNDLCRQLNLPIPRLDDVVSHLDPVQKAEVESKIMSIKYLNSSTLNLSNVLLEMSLKQRMVNIFPKVATGHPVPPVPPFISSFALANSAWPIFPQAPSWCGSIRSSRQYRQRGSPMTRGIRWRI